MCYHHANGFQVAGYVRCSRLVRRAAFEDSMDTMVDAGPANKKSKMTTSTETSEKDKTSSASAGHSLDTADSITAATVPDVGRETRQKSEKVESDEEFVCVIRPADVSFPYSRDNQLFCSLLSTASMVEHMEAVDSSKRKSWLDLE